MHKFRKGIVLLMTVVSLSACGMESVPEVQNQTGFTDTGYVMLGSESYDSADTCVVVEIHDSDNTVTFLNLEKGRNYTLNYDGVTKFYDKYGENISLAQIEKGDIVDVIFLKSAKHLVRLQKSTKGWKYENVEKYELNTVRHEVVIGTDTYKMTDNTLFYSEGRAIDVMNLNSADILNFQGIDNTVLSVTVAKGHGYLRLVNAESFVGGWIEIGQKQIQRITEDMLLTVPEGNYQVNISYKGSGGIKNAVIRRNEETSLDIGDLKIAESETGTVLFSLTPSDAELYVDGVETDASQPVILEYGLHQLIVRAEGYQSLTQYLRVGEESAGIHIVLDEENSTEYGSTSTTTSTSSDTSSGSSGTSSESSTASGTGSTSTDTSSSASSTSGTTDSTSASSTEVDTTTNYYKVYIDAPENVEIYLDGNYVGISPTSFRKTEGTHEIILRKNGYETRSYTINVDNEDKDISYSFAELEKRTN